MRRLLTLATVALFASAALAGCADNDGDTQTPGTTPTGSTTPTGTTTPTGATPTTPVTPTAEMTPAEALADCSARYHGMPLDAPDAPATQPPSSGAAGKAPTASGASNKDTFTIMTIGEPESLDPHYDYESAGGQIISNVYEQLYTYGGESAIDLVPSIAAAMPAYSDDGTVLTIPIREGIKFHDGTDLTAEDVKFSLDRIIIHNDPDSPVSIYYGLACAEEYGHIDPADATQQDRDNYLAANAVNVVDDHTVAVRLAYPDPSFLYRLAFQAASIVSKDAFCANTPNAGDDCFTPVGETRDTWADEHEAGSGAFKLETWDRGTQVVLVRFDDYWGEKPDLTRVIVKKVDDFNTRLTALKAGEADDVYIPVDQADQVANVPGVEIIENPSWSVGFIGYNQAFCGGPQAAGFADCMSQNGDAAPKGADGTADPLFFADKEMRMAWSHAFDYDTYIDDIYGGHGSLLNGVLPAGIFGYDASIEAPRQDLEAAKAHLAASNHPDGFQVTIYYNTGNSVREKTALLLAQNLEELGDSSGATITADVVDLDFSTAFLPKQRAQALPVFYLGWLPDYAFPDNYVLPFAHSEKGVFAARIGYHNAEVDTLIDQMLRETDEAALTAGYSQIVQKVNDDYAYLFLAQASNFHVQRTWVGGYFYNPMHSGSPQAGDFSSLYKA